MIQETKKGGISKSHKCFLRLFQIPNSIASNFQLTTERIITLEDMYARNILSSQAQLC